ncbi:MAG TPA: MBL fold metallo-hydrolase [Hyalangium sp.]|nr:MBL fold metallo-hydrolase [Hyalangium sp.]
MHIRFWGTRGSLPKPGPTTLRYGGNTSCVEVRMPDGTLLVLDCGTGAQALGQALMASGKKPVRGHLFIGHTHWDHIQGLPFFAPIFVPGNEWDIYAPKGMGTELKQTLAGQMQYSYFPVSLESLSATLRYHELLEQTLALGEAHITTRYLNHPALTLGYRIEVGGVSFAYVTDHEPNGRTQACGRTHTEAWHHQADTQHAEFIRGVDLLVHDAQYTAAEYPDRIGWGHSTVEYVVDMACDAEVKRLALFHHDPMRSDDQLDAVVAAARERAARQGSSLEIFAAAEGQLLELTTSSSAPKRPMPSPAEEAKELAQELRGKHVLLAIPHDKTAEQVQEALRADGLHTTRLGNAEEIGQLLERAPPALVLIEHSPGLQDGLKFSRQVRRMVGPQAQGIPIVLMADAAHAEQLEACLAEDGTDLLLRPFSSAHVRTKARAWLLRTLSRWAPAARPADEPGRLEAVLKLGVPELGREERFDRIARIAARSLDVPLSSVNLVYRDRAVCKGSNRDGGLSSLPRDASLCAHTILEDGEMIIPDAHQDAQFGGNVLFSELHFRSYAGIPLRTRTGYAVGTLCVYDHRPRQFGPEDRQILADLAAIAQRELIGEP